MKNWHATSYSTQPRSRRYGHGVTQSRRKPPRRRCRPTSSLGRSDRPVALLLSSLFSWSETLLSRFSVASQPVLSFCHSPRIKSDPCISADRARRLDTLRGAPARPSAWAIRTLQYLIIEPRQHFELCERCLPKVLV